VTPFAGKVVAVTGAARGIGNAIATAMAREGARVALGDVDAEAVAAAAAAVPGSVGLTVDVRSQDSVAAFVAEAQRQLGGPLDVLVNNAGVMWVGAFDEEPEVVSRRMLEVNLLGVVNGFRVVAPAMRARGAGHIVTIASAATRLAPPGEATYAASKHGVLGYCTAVRRELRRSGVQVSVVCPAVVATELAAGTSGGAGPVLSPEQVAETVVAVVRRPRFLVWVPRQVRALVWLLEALPRPASDWLAARTVPDQVRRTDRGARADYELRLTRSELDE